MIQIRAKQQQIADEDLSDELNSSGVADEDAPQEAAFEPNQTDVVEQQQKYSEILDGQAQQNQKEPDAAIISNIDPDHK